MKHLSAPLFLMAALALGGIPDAGAAPDGPDSRGLPQSIKTVSTPTLIDEGLLAHSRRQFARGIWTGTCDEPQLDHPRWQGFPVRLCSYSALGVTVRSHMLNASAEQLARWTATACTDTASSRPKTCVEKLAAAIRLASSGVFPVAGFIPEPSSSGGGAGHAPVCYLFRDGLTVRTDSVPGTPAARNGRCPAGDANSEPVRRAMRFARVASTTRDDYRRNGGTLPVGTDANGDPRWVDVTRSLYQEAWTSDRNALITARARSLRLAGELP